MPSIVVALLTLAVGVITAPVLQGCGSDFCDEPSVPWYDAGRYIGEYRNVEGVVQSVEYVPDAAGQPTFINLGEDFPSQDRFQIVIFRDNLEGDGGEIGIFDSRVGDTMKVNGLIEDYEGVLQMEMVIPQQLCN